MSASLLQFPERTVHYSLHITESESVVQFSVDGTADTPRDRLAVARTCRRIAEMLEESCNGE